MTKFVDLVDNLIEAVENRQWETFYRTFDQVKLAMVKDAEETAKNALITHYRNTCKDLQIARDTVSRLKWPDTTGQ